MLVYYSMHICNQVALFPAINYCFFDLPADTLWNIFLPHVGTAFLKIEYVGSFVLKSNICLLLKKVNR